MSVRNPWGQPLRCRQCSICSTCYSSFPTRKATQNGTSRKRRTSSKKLSGTERTATTQNGTSRTRRTSSAPERLTARVPCTHFWLLTSVGSSPHLHSLTSATVQKTKSGRNPSEMWCCGICCGSILSLVQMSFFFVLNSFSYITIPQNKGK